MVRIGRQIPHLDTVDVYSIEAAFSSNKKWRYLLSMKYNDTLMDTARSKSVVVIMKNPSSADESMADATIRKVETFVYHRIPDARYLHILNIFALRATDPGDLNLEFKKNSAEDVIGPENDHVISKTCIEADYLVLGWGNSSGIDSVLYEERIYAVKNLLREIPQHKVYQVVGQKKTVHPLHGLMWGYDYKLQSAADYLNE